MRTIYGQDGYGPERLKEFDGHGLFSQMRAVIASPLSNAKAQRPIQKFSGHTAKVRLQRVLALVRRAK